MVLPYPHAIWFRVAALSGASSVAAAAYGAHALKGDAKLIKSYEDGNRLRDARNSNSPILQAKHALKILKADDTFPADMVNSVMLAVCPMLPVPHVSGCLFLAGTLVFSGSLYYAALSNDRQNGKLAPIGGSTIILAWLTLLL